ncbi:MAG: 2,3-bisphosphoglycerate-independent phosphoglycerate mutase [Anaerolineae bacterium]
MEILPDSLAVEAATKIVFVVIDGLGGMEAEGRTGTELQVARTPNLDQLAEEGICGVLDPVAPGVAPGSGPAHLALFGYDPVRWSIGRGVLSALGIDFELQESDVAARANFATLDAEGRVVDRRAGRIDTETGAALCRQVLDGYVPPEGGEVFFEPVRQYRAALVLRGEGLDPSVSDTDPQQTGVPPRPCRPLKSAAEETADRVNHFLAHAQHALRTEPAAQVVLLRGFAQHRTFPTFEERYLLDALAIANYPMYRGLARLLGMRLHPITSDLRSEFDALGESLSAHEFLFLHVKEADSRGEDGDFDGKVAVLEEVDGLIPLVVELAPDVLVVTGDHSTPAALRRHTWHPVPVLLRADTARSDRVGRFEESSCLQGEIGRMPMAQLMSLALAHAERLAKFGA